MNGRDKRLSDYLVVLVLLLTLSALSACTGQQTFLTPEDGSHALADAVQHNDTTALQAILGPHASAVIDSGDRVVDAQRRAAFLKAYHEASRFERVGSASVILVIGHNEWPMPIPLVRTSTGWQFDTPQGIDEILTRRLGRNELATGQVCLAIIDAAQDYAARDPERHGMPEYPTRFVSTAGKHDGLYWPTKPNEPESPLGPLLAAAASDGSGDTLSRPPTPYHGYIYRILTQQGYAAPGGARDYLVRGHMIGGFAVLAYPAIYGVSGIMSFLVNQDGLVYEKNLGEQTSALAAAMTSFNPETGWQQVAGHAEND